MQVAELVVGLVLRVALKVLQGLLVVLQPEQSVGLGQQSFGVVRVDGNGVFAAGHRLPVVLLHELRVGQRVPVALLEGVVVNQLVEDALRVVILPHSEERAPHQFLEVVAVLGLGPHHPFHRLLVRTVVVVEVDHVEHVVLHLLGRALLILLAQVFVGLV